MTHGNVSRTKMMYPLVRELAADGIPVAVTCGVLGFSRQAYYAWLAGPVTDRDWDVAHTINALRNAHADDPEFGYRLLADELDEVGIVAGENRVHRLCRQEQIWSTTVKKGRKHGKGRPGPAVHDDLVQRQFDAPEPDVLWLADITEHPTAEGKLYMCAIKDACSNRIVGWAIDSRMKARLAVAALEMAVALRQPDGPVIVHAHRGSQFRSRAFRAALRRHGLVGSMGRVASAADNAAMESWFALLQKNVLNRHKTWATREQLHQAIVWWTARTYNHRRRQRALGKMTPVAYELMLTDTPLTRAA